MNFSQVKIFEYGLQCFLEINSKSTESNHKFSYVVQCDNDVFIGESYYKGPRNTPTEQRLNLEKEVVEEPFSPNSSSKNSYHEIRSKIHKYFTTEWGFIKTTSLIQNPHLLLETLLEITADIEPESSENNFWYNYISLKHDYTLDFKIADITKDYSIISLVSQN